MSAAPNKTPHRRPSIHFVGGNTHPTKAKGATMMEAIIRTIESKSEIGIVNSNIQNIQIIKIPKAHPAAF